MHIEVREERHTDHAGIRDVNRRAFGRDQEADLVDALRANGAVSLSLVATENDHVVGHILYSPVLIGTLEGVGLGPMAVLPEYQRRGVGSALVEAGNRQLEIAGCPFVVVLGHAAFYPRFGFQPARPIGVTCEWDVRDDVFMIRLLDSQKIRGVSGQARYRPEFSTAT